MAHILVLIIGKNLNNSTAIKEKLAPFCEFEFQEKSSLYVQDIDKTKEALTNYKELLTQNIRKNTSLLDFQNYIADRYGVAIIDKNTLIDIEDKHKYGYAIFEDGKLIKLIERTNPNGKWDWYQVGGRWHNSIICYDGAIQSGMAFKGESNFYVNDSADQNSNMVDIVRYDYIDFIAMRKEAKRKRRNLWELAQKEFCNQCDIQSDIDLDTLRYNVLNDHNALLSKHYEKYLSFNFEEWLKEKKHHPDKYFHIFNKFVSDSIRYKKIDDWIQDALVLSPYAIIDENGWQEYGTLRWSKTIFDEREDKKWHEFTKERFARAEPDDWFVIVDCHF